MRLALSGRMDNAVPLVARGLGVDEERARRWLASFLGKRGLDDAR